MFPDEKALDQLKGCDICRVDTMTEAGNSPLVLCPVTVTRTTCDNLSKRDELHCKPANGMMKKELSQPKARHKFIIKQSF